MKKLVLPLVGLLVISGVAALFATKNMTDKKSENFPNSSTETVAQAQNMPSTQSPQSQTPGRYAQYTEQKLSEKEYTTTILFFHAAWCPECRGFKQALTSEPLPDMVQILEVNYDTSSDLKKKHGVTLQSTFVKVDQSGSQVSKWVGYGKDKSVQAVLANL